MSFIENLRKAAMRCSVSISAASVAAQILMAQTMPREPAVLRVRDSVSCWFLLHGENPGQPGKWLQAPPAQCQNGQRNPFTGASGSSPALSQTRSYWAIRGGDQILVEGHSASADAYLHAEALDPARPGEGFRARLMFGTVVRVIAQGPGRALLTPAAGGRP